jgi:predicted Zn-dependent protease
MKFSRTAERQADVLGTQMLYDAGYDPQAMADFFDTIAASGGGRPPEFFSTHPNPENRKERIEEEMGLLGPGENAQRDSDDCRSLQVAAGSPKAALSPSSSGRRVRRGASMVTGTRFTPPGTRRIGTCRKTGTR